MAATAATESAILPLLPRHSELLNILSETDYAGPSYASQVEMLADLNKQLAANQYKLRLLSARRVQEFAEHKDIRDSVVRRFAHKATGQRTKFEEKAKKEEREYFEALRNEQIEQQTNRNLLGWINEGVVERDRLKRELDRHDAAQKELDQMYDSVFKGRTEGYAEEDAKEEQTKEAKGEYDEARRHAEDMGQAVGTMDEAQRNMVAAQKALDEALDASRMDMFGGGSYADMMERSALQNAERYVAEVRHRVLLAQHFDGNIVSLPNVHIASGSIMTDVFFDNIFTDMDFHDKIKRSKTEVTQVQNALKDQTMKARARLQEAKQALAAKEDTLKVRRGELQQLRENAFRQVAEIGAPPAYAPPEYTE